MIDKILESDIGIERCERPELVVAEMKAQLGYSRFLRKIGQELSDSYKTCQELYRRARDTLIKLGGENTNFPKRIR